MSFLLDTNICSAHLRRPSGLAHRFMQHTGRLFVPTVVLGELYAWAFKRPDPSPVLHLVEDELLRDVDVLDFDSSCAYEFGKLRGQMLRGGSGRVRDRPDDRLGRPGPRPDPGHE